MSCSIWKSSLPGISEDLSLDTGLKKLIASLRYSISLHYYLFLNYKEVPKARLFFSFFLFFFLFLPGSMLLLFGNLGASFSYPPFHLTI